MPVAKEERLRSGRSKSPANRIQSRSPNNCAIELRRSPPSCPDRESRQRAEKETRARRIEPPRELKRFAELLLVSWIWLSWLFLPRFLEELLKLRANNGRPSGFEIFPCIGRGFRKRFDARVC